MVVIDCPEIPIVLFDDVITSGSSFIAACWRLQEGGNSPAEGLAIARRTVNQEPKMFALEERLEIPPRPLF
jgi:orotate phosphoribosyltransferase